MKKRWVVAGLVSATALVAGCAKRTTSDDNTPCTVYLECVNAVDRDAFEELREFYGKGGGCFDELDEAECQAMCEVALAALAEVAEDEGACDPENIDPPETTGETTGEHSGHEGVAFTEPRGVQILVVVDNSGTMIEEQEALAASIGTLVDSLDESVDYRIAVTTTDNGNYWCQGAGISSPEAGNFVLSSCRSRLDEFTFLDVDGAAACERHCPEQWPSIQTKPTPIATDPEVRPRPWIERRAGETNLPDGLDMTTALQCLVPQGINGCGFEAPLESMYKGLRRTQEENEDEFGFINDGDLVAVLFVTDEADCSADSAWEEIFYPSSEGGNQVFWSLPNQQQTPTSAVCWNAGVQCSPDGSSSFDSCEPMNKDVEGNAGVSDDAAVVFPMTRYVEFLTEFERRQQELTPGQELIVGAIAGVPQGYPAAPIVYTVGADANDPNSFQTQYGIGQGCTSSTTEAVPPVRLRAFAENFAIDEQPLLSSVCNPSYEDELRGFAAAIQGQLRPSCLPACVADSDATTPLLEPNCAVKQTSRATDGTVLETAVPPCANGTLPAGASECFTMRTDKAGLTPGPDDDMSPTCSDEGWNLEFEIVRAAGVPAPAGAAMTADCALSQNKAIDCPDLP